MTSQTRPCIILATAGLVAASACAQNVLFDFDSAPAHTSLPITLTVGDITAVCSCTGQGYSIQPASTLGSTPAGFAGNCIYPNSVFAADLGQASILTFDTLQQQPVAKAERLKFLGRGERQAPAAFEELAQAAVAGTGLAAHDTRGDLLAGFAPGTATALPIFPAYRPINRDRGGS